MPGDGGRQPVVDAARQRGSLGGCDLLQRGRRVGDHLDVDAGFVHLGEPQVAEVEQPFAQLRRAAGVEAGEMGDEFLVPVMLFEGDDRAMRFRQHAACVPKKIWPGAW